ncbi:MAG: hypothetical protein HZA19_04390 [Nitrospirae bacterium]|nr:hypothetical protein [Nitrospirota bacterium]
MFRNITSKIMNPVFLGLFFLLTFISPLHAEEQEKISYQGVISAFDPSDRFMIVNERKVLLTPETKFVNPKEREVSFSEWTSGKWVYVVGYLSEKGPVADKLYLLPNRVKSSDSAHYPFMSGDEENKNPEQNNR